MTSTTIRLDTKDLSQLLGVAYEAALDAPSWRGFAEDTARTCRCQLAMVEYQDEDNPQRSFVATSGLDGFEEIFAGDQFRTSDDQYLQAIRAQPAGTVRLGSEVVAPGAMLKSGAYSRLARPWDLEHFLFGAITPGNGVSAYFSLCRTGREEPFVPGDKALVSQLLLGHLRRSLALHQDLDFAHSRNALLSGVLDLARFGIIVYDRQARPMLMNKEATALFAATDGLTLRNGELHSTDPATQSRLTAALEVARQAALGWFVAPPAPVPVKRRSSPHHYQVVFSPLLLGSDRSALPSGSAVLAIIKAGRRGNLPSARLELNAVYGLSRAECSLCEALLEGKTLLEAASGLDISRNTAKTHLARIFDKTGVRSQSTLLRLLAFGERSQVTPP